MTEQFIKLRQKLIEKDFGNMNDRQFEAVVTTEGAVLVLAGAGSGKTTVLVNRIANIVKYGKAYNSDFVPMHTDADILAAEDYINGKTDTLPYGVFSVSAPRPWEILAITFTNKAANELKERINAKLGEGGESLWAGTFHSVCGKILRMNAERVGFTSHFTVYDTDDQKRLIKNIMKDHNVDEKMFPIRGILSAISSAKDSLVSPAEFKETAGHDYRQQTIAKIYEAYQKRLKDADAMDFDDMINYTVQLFSENEDVLEYYGSKFKYIMVDEYQDTNHAQYELIHLLSSVHGNLCVVGDDDQSIYRFRGATIENILNFEDDYKNAKVIRLEQNYRSVGNILNAANAVIANNRGRKGKNLWTDKGDGDLIKLYTAADERDEARYVADKVLASVRGGAKFSDHAVLYRINAQSAAIENVFARSGISYRVIGGMRFYERKEIRDVLAYLNLINNNNDDVRLRRIINEPKRGIGDTTINHAAEISRQLGISLFEVLDTADQYAPISRAAGKLKEFCDMIKSISAKIDETPISELLTEVLDKSGYRISLMSDADPKNADRLQNVDELVNNVKQYELENDEPTLSNFLEEIALVSDIDSMNDSEDKVTLMTVHSAKGLEFEKVFLIGLEEGIFPGNQSIYEGASEIEEERRLMYVAITRAKRQLTISNAVTRMVFGSTNRNMPSRFLKEIPDDFCDMSAKVPSSFGYSGGFGGGSYTPRATRPSVAPSYSKPATSTLGGFSVPKKAAPTSSESYSAGQRVEHGTFGKGLIVSVSPMGNDTLLEIAFDTVGTKKLMAAYAKLKKM
ncbi:MAG: UvrD-helicase domain-containing protein [Clostridia bacterium]|nr:UvrD-helicase domain-containing protein [Clostridia bacterium]